VFFREWGRIFAKPIYMFAMVIAPLFCYVFFVTLMSEGMPKDFPVGVVVQDNSKAARTLVRNLDSFSETKVVAHYPNMADATHDMQSGKIYGIYYIPRNTSRDAYGQRQPRLSFYTNNSILVAGSLLYKDFKMMSELGSGYATRQVLYGHGITEKQSMALLQPIVIDSHAVGNPWLSYSIYLNNTLVPGILMMMIFLLTVYAIGEEIKERTAREWLHLGNNSIWISVYAKLLPQTIIFTLMGILYNVYLYGFQHYPCNSGIFPMLLATFCFVLASQSMGILMIGTLPTLRYGLSFATLWGVVSFSISGFSFPVLGMHPMLQALSNLFPLRHYFLIYVDQALNGYPMVYSWQSYLALLLFMMLPYLIAPRLKSALIYYKYVP
jgi:ABC-2 type transport system permease protein